MSLCLRDSSKDVLFLLVSLDNHKTRTLKRRTCGLCVLLVLYFVFLFGTNWDLAGSLS